MTVEYCDHVSLGAGGKKSKRAVAAEEKGRRSCSVAAEEKGRKSCCAEGMVADIVALQLLLAKRRSQSSLIPYHSWCVTSELATKLSQVAMKMLCCLLCRCVSYVYDKAVYSWLSEILQDMLPTEKGLNNMRNPGLGFERNRTTCDRHSELYMCTCIVCESVMDRG